MDKGLTSWKITNPHPPYKTLPLHGKKLSTTFLENLENSSPLSVPKLVYLPTYLIFSFLSVPFVFCGDVVLLNLISRFQKSFSK